eukprot:7628397-Karenia_brevis.AAC.1
MKEVCERLHLKPQASCPQDLSAWHGELHTLHKHLHEKLVDYRGCPVCGEESSNKRFRQDS